ncbi:hypothetical protein B0H14DRAFT_2576980 [Mycena olivaceomarginata]|nr:hypothetical protein B0H14DRAFT_2576980 [Mycena olivaceomarginata]
MSAHAARRLRMHGDLRSGPRYLLCAVPGPEQREPSPRPRHPHRQSVTYSSSRRIRLSVTSVPRGTTLGISLVCGVRRGNGDFLSDGMEVLSRSHSLPRRPPPQTNLTSQPRRARHSPIGAIAGFVSTNDDLSTAVFNYAVLGGTTQTPPGSSPSNTGDNSFSHATTAPATLESAIWTFDQTNNALTSQWRNTDGSSPVTHIVYTNEKLVDAGAELLMLTERVSALQDAFGVGNPEVTFTCVPSFPTSS